MRDLIVIKYGGSLLEEHGHRSQFLREVAAVSAVKSMILVHGGGKEISRQMENAGLITKFVQGRRFTDEAAMAVVEQALSELNRDIVAELKSYGAAAQGFSGRTDHLLEASPLTQLGRVGIPRQVDVAVLDRIIAATRLPVFYSVAEDADRNPLNINADDFATAIAMAVQATRLVFLTDTGGVLDSSGTLIPRITPDDAMRLARENVITGGMWVKTQACIEALRQGVGSVDIVKTIRHLSGATAAPEGTIFTHGH